MSSQKNIDDYRGDGVMKDDAYILNEEMGEEEYSPQDESEETAASDPNPRAREDYDFRDSTKKVMKQEEQGKHLFAEDESGVAPEKLYNEIDESADRKVVSLVAASHRKGRSAEEKRKSAEEASKLYEEATGYPLEINEQGEVVTGPPATE
ncbi:hypothetical protein BKA69DRAFT_1124590 [Paraphysoderma sedebokerense]|nr:hypothetical protein BKA69DRAFT_1124590 [Paraphysoderma sedebokerense]